MLNRTFWQQQQNHSLLPYREQGNALTQVQEAPLYGPMGTGEAHASPGTGGAGLRFRFARARVNP